MIKLKVIPMATESAYTPAVRGELRFEVLKRCMQVCSVHNIMDSDIHIACIIPSEVQSVTIVCSVAI